MKIKIYTLGDLLGESERFRLYPRYPEDKPETKSHILKIATDVRWNGDLDREAFILEKLGQRAAHLEEEFAKKGGKPETRLNYQISFPRLVDSFVASEHEGRQVSVLDFSEACEQLSDLAPVRFIVERDHLRVDAGTSVWMLGKLLKLLAFAHGEGVSVGSVTSGNVLLNRGHHYVTVFDWSLATLHPEGVPSGDCCDEISEAARVVIGALGGNPDEGTIPPDGDLTDGRYEEMLRELASGTVGDALKAHGEFYELADTIWKRGFRPFTAHPLRR